jgi:hypothetical protein
MAFDGGAAGAHPPGLCRHRERHRFEHRVEHRLAGLGRELRDRIDLGPAVAYRAGLRDRLLAKPSSGPGRAGHAP